MQQDPPTSIEGQYAVVLDSERADGLSFPVPSFIDERTVGFGMSAEANLFGRTDDLSFSYLDTHVSENRQSRTRIKVAEYNLGDLDEKRRIKVMKNRISASASRNRQRQRTVELETQVGELKEQLRTLHGLLAHLNEQITSLEEANRVLKASSVEQSRCMTSTSEQAFASATLPAPYHRSGATWPLLP
mmetsp:Transcript_78449/g.211001  ORF Transcript_78449/g.211001 Transcript_78449/m.211001 type:complete len:188 (+) Transcript_78449:68-631(+)